MAGRADAACAFCKATPCQCFIGAEQTDEASLDVVAYDEDGDEIDRLHVVVGEDGDLHVGR